MEKDSMVPVSYRLPSKVVSDLRKLSDKTDFKITVLVRRALEQFIEREKDAKHVQ